MSDTIKILLGVLLLLVTCWWCCNVQHSGGAALNAGGTAPGAAIPATIVPAAFAAKFSGGKAVLSGFLPDQAAKDQVLAKAATVYGAGNFVDQLKIGGPGVGTVQAAPSWLNWALGLMSVPKNAGENSSLELSKDTVTVQGVLPDQAAKTKLLSEVTAVIPPGVNLNDLLTIKGNQLNEAQLAAQSKLNQLLIKGIEFDLGKADITPVGAATLDQVAAALQTEPSVKVEIGGHTDNRGASAQNNVLSLSRANSVKRYLISKGVTGDRMTTKGYGSAQPISTENTEAGWQRNRRIEFRIVSGNGAVQAK